MDFPHNYEPSSGFAARMHALTKGAMRLSLNAIAKTGSALISSISSAHTLVSILELLQSLILLQIITLLHLTTSEILRKQAESRGPLLSSLTKKLFLSVPAYLPASLSRIRPGHLRIDSCTIFMAYKLRAVHSVMTRGHFILTAFGEALPLNQRSLSWDHGVPIVQNQVSVESESDWASLDTELISNKELVNKWDTGAVRQPRFFDEILMVAVG